jgi:hypothetical protein
MRPSTFLRVERLNLLAAAFSRKDLGHPDVAALLACSASSARNYLFALLDAGLIEQIPREQRAGHSIKPVYRLASTMRIPDRGETIDGAGDIRPRELPGMGRFIDFSSDAGAIAVRRDPLVTALFGAPGPRKLLG